MNVLQLASAICNSIGSARLVRSFIVVLKLLHYYYHQLRWLIVYSPSFSTQACMRVLGRSEGPRLHTCTRLRALRKCGVANAKDHSKHKDEFRDFADRRVVCCLLHCRWTIIGWRWDVHSAAGCGRGANICRAQREQWLMDTINIYIMFTSSVALIWFCVVRVRPCAKARHSLGRQFLRLTRES